MTRPATLFPAELPCDAAQRQNRRVLVAGCGYLGLPLARQLHALGWQVTGVTQSAESATRLRLEPFRVLACDIADPAAVARLGSPGSFDAVIHCASSGRRGAEVYRHVYREGARHLLEALRPGRFLFTGSTSVYAQTDGGIVTEESPARPDRETGQILREAEDLALAAGGIVARLAGLYGPDRWALLQRFRDGTAVIEGDGARCLNQIHRADAASALVLLLDPRIAPGIYNVADDTPSTQREIYAAFARHFGQPLPPVAPSDPQRKRGWTHKRVSNAKLRALGWEPLYPSFRDALRAVPIP